MQNLIPDIVPMTVIDDTQMNRRKNSYNVCLLPKQHICFDLQN